ncbi:MAG TPA: hypothetical protein VGQ44_17155 [Gemmatimonadaceae bacterium]|jgi:hypothetical protein|nr:hypothetical protein [Gemmatimonadaceae bacterium]
MKPVTQTHVGVGNPRANCLMAAIASIVECPIDSLPDVYDHEQRGLDWFGVLRDALAPHRLVPVIYDQNSKLFPPIAPKGYHVACGTSPRQDEQHAVVALDGEIVFDPHPSRDGLRGDVAWWILLIPAAAA